LYTLKSTTKMKHNKKKYSTKPVDKANTVNETTTTYTNKQIAFFKSFEEENEYTRRQYASMTPEECLGVVTRMRLTAFPYLDFNLKPWGDTIFFD